MRPIKKEMFTVFPVKSRSDPIVGSGQKLPTLDRDHHLVAVAKFQYNCILLHLLSHFHNFAMANLHSFIQMVIMWPEEEQRPSRKWTKLRY
jgi:hypothetical protein